MLPTISLRARLTITYNARMVRRCFSTPGSLLYRKTHEWALPMDDVVTVGITDHAQSALGDIVFVELPDIDSDLDVGDTFGALESVKAASDVYSPVSGKVVERNEAIVDTPELVNKDPLGEGWFIKVKITELSEIDDLKSADDDNQLLDEEAYKALCDEEEH